MIHQILMKYLDKMDESCSIIGAVNTVVNNEGILKGYNTDMDGFLEPLKKRNISMSKYLSTIIAQRNMGIYITVVKTQGEINCRDVGTEAYSCLEKMPPRKKKRGKGAVLLKQPVWCLIFGF